MAAESIYQQAQTLFQAGLTSPDSLSHEAADALLRQKAMATYQVLATGMHPPDMPEPKKPEPTPSPMPFETVSTSEIPKPVSESFPDPFPMPFELEPFTIETPEQAKALLVLAHFDRALNRMVMEQQPLTKPDVRSAYRRILKHYHPDQTHVAITGEIIKKVQDAYSLLRSSL